MRSFAGLLVLEDIYDDIPTDNPDIINLANTLFNPHVSIVEEDCGTTLGKYETMSYDLQGLTELATDTPLTRDRIVYLLSQGKYEVYVRHTSTCISKGGVCNKCFKATYPDHSATIVNSLVNIAPEYLFNAEVLDGNVGQLAYSTETDPTSYEKYYLFINGVFTDQSQYTLSNGTLTLKTPLTQDADLTLRFINLTKSPFLVWLAGTYSGALLGMKALISSPLPIRSLLLASLLDENRLQLIEEMVKASSNIPSDYSEYIQSIKDPLEKALYMVALYSIYSQAEI